MYLKVCKILILFQILYLIQGLIQHCTTFPKHNVHLFAWSYWGFHIAHLKYSTSHPTLCDPRSPYPKILTQHPKSHSLCILLCLITTFPIALSRQPYLLAVLSFRQTREGDVQFLRFYYIFIFQEPSNIFEITPTPDVLCVGGGGGDKAAKYPRGLERPHWIRPLIGSSLYFSPFCSALSIHCSKYGISLLCIQSGIGPAMDGKAKYTDHQEQLPNPAVIKPASNRQMGNNKKGANVSVSLCGGLPIRSDVNVGGECLWRMSPPRHTSHSPDYHPSGST